ncbi:cyanophycin synthetase [Mucilaginibacter polytrichastri]|uniref:Cyanophycin synthetase n=1 Tax=Mucilaginibacter polytrichastri TaxID=1302689 RepID=A0A1Q6A4F6_9SPHI|nr:cyanophycin synthetase [Mucilaginibacter polytrichastri]OKS88899.1 Cyanophycin synthetase [Mucilaginibacter polytrichastri]SFT25731.1 cyanophycin synthetase [Mucilaginibacter polytrichastri]
MKIENIQVLRGPNIWSSNRKKLIQMRLNLEELEHQPTNKIDGFYERLKTLIPSLYEHRCSPGIPGGFFQRVIAGTWMGHVIEHIALEIQTLAGMDTGYGRTRETHTPGVYNVVFNYLEEKVGIFAAEAAVRIAEALIKGDDYNLEADIQTMKEIRENTRLGPSTGSIVEEAIARDIPWIRLNNQSLVQLGYGKNQVRIRATMTEKTSSIAVDLAGNKDETKRILQEHAIPVAKGITITSVAEVAEAIRKVGFPLVFKPLDGNHGRGATINVKTEDDAIAAFEHAAKISRKVIVEKFITGYDFRVLVIDNQMVAAALRIPAHVKGNGELNIQQLIDKENSDPRRGYGHENVLTEISVDRDTMDLLEKKGYTLETVPTDGEIVYLKSTANLSTGGTSVDVTDHVHPQNVFICERISRVIGLDICGIDIMADNLTEPLTENGGVILEVNAAPGFRMHIAPSEGLPRNVAGHVIDMLYPPGKSARIPIIATTGTNGKTTTTRLIAHLIKSSGYRVGYTTSDGIYVQNTMMLKGDTTGPVSTEFILKDPSVDFAVLETARGGILRSGLGFSKCDIGVITNIQPDHLGIADINTLEDLARVKSVVINSVKKDGWGILNADNEYCVKIGRKADCKIAYFSRDEENPVIKAHCAKGGIACIAENGYITIKKGDWKIRVQRTALVPLTFGGTVSFMIENVMAATLAAYVWGIKTEEIKTSLTTFIPSVAQTPGRMNIFNFKDFRFMVDFAHNPDGYLGVKEFLKSIDSPMKIGLISGTGDRRDEDIRELGAIAATMFDRILLRQENHTRGRTRENLLGLMVEGIKSVNPDMNFELLTADQDPIAYAISLAQPGTFITTLSDAVDNAVELVQNFQEKERYHGI